MQTEMWTFFETPPDTKTERDTPLQVKYRSIRYIPFSLFPKSWAPMKLKIFTERGETKPSYTLKTITLFPQTNGGIANTYKNVMAPETSFAGANKILQNQIILSPWSSFSQSSSSIASLPPISPAASNASTSGYFVNESGSPINFIAR